MQPTELLFVLAMQGQNPYAVSSAAPIPRVVNHVVGDETPSIVSMRSFDPAELPTSRSGEYQIAKPLKELVQSVGEYVRAMAFLPGDPEADEIVERLMRMRQETKRPLKRR